MRSAGKEKKGVSLRGRGKDAKGRRTKDHGLGLAEINKTIFQLPAIEREPKGLWTHGKVRRDVATRRRPARHRGGPRRRVRRVDVGRDAGSLHRMHQISIGLLLTA